MANYIDIIQRYRTQGDKESSKILDNFIKKVRSHKEVTEDDTKAILNEHKALLEVKNAYLESIKGLSQTSKLYQEYSKQLSEVEKKIQEYVKTGAQSKRQEIENIKIQQQLLTLEERRLRNQDAIIEKTQEEEKAAAKLNSVLKKMQDLSRQKSDQQLGQGSAKTAHDLAWMVEEYKNLQTEAQKYIDILGESHEAVKHFYNGINWTEENNPFRAYRNEAVKARDEIIKLYKENSKLSLQGGHKNLIASNRDAIKEDEKYLQDYERDTLKTIEVLKERLGLNQEEIAFLERSLDINKEKIAVAKEETNRRHKAMLEDKNIAESEKQIAEEQKKQQDMLAEEQKKQQDMLATEFKVFQKNKEDAIRAAARVEREEAKETERIQKEAINEQLKNYKEYYELERKINELSTNKNGEQTASQEYRNLHQITQLQLQKQNVQEIIKENSERLKALGIEENEVKKIAEKKNQEEKARAATEAHNKDLQQQAAAIDQTLKNFAKFTLYYQFIRKLSQGIREAISTMKELDKTFNDVRIVTQDSAEATNQLAQEYAELAKTMGSTTTEVANGAVEWLRQRKNC